MIGTNINIIKKFSAPGENIMIDSGKITRLMGEKFVAQMYQYRLSIGCMIQPPLQGEYMALKWINILRTPRAVLNDSLKLIWINQAYGWGRYYSLRTTFWLRRRPMNVANTVMPFIHQCCVWTSGPAVCKDFTPGMCCFCRFHLSSLAREHLSLTTGTMSSSYGMACCRTGGCCVNCSFCGAVIPGSSVYVRQYARCDNNTEVIPSNGSSFIVWWWTRNMMSRILSGRRRSHRAALQNGCRYTSVIILFSPHPEKRLLVLRIFALSYKPLFIALACRSDNFVPIEQRP